VLEALLGSLTVLRVVNAVKLAGIILFWQFSTIAGLAEFHRANGRWEMSPWTGVIVSWLAKLGLFGCYFQTSVLHILLLLAVLLEA